MEEKNVATIDRKTAIKCLSIFASVVTCGAAMFIGYAFGHTTGYAQGVDAGYNIEHVLSTAEKIRNV